MKNILLAVIVCLATLSGIAQDSDTVKRAKGFQKEKLFFGGNFGLTFGDYTLINVSPQIGYRFTKIFAAGVGINAQYIGYKERDIYTNDVYRKVSQGVTGLNVFGRIYPINQFFIQLQPEANYLFGKQTYYQPTKQEYKLDAVIAPSLLAGGGAAMPAGRGAFIVSVFYDVLQDKNSPYGKKPVYNFGYNIGF